MRMGTAAVEGTPFEGRLQLIDNQVDARSGTVRVRAAFDNKDGTLSVFTTLIESAAPHATDFTDLSQTGLAALYRELSYNAPGRRDTLTGKAGDRNTELVLRKG